MREIEKKNVINVQSTKIFSTLTPRREDQLFHFFCSLLWVVKDFSRWLKSCWLKNVINVQSTKIFSTLTPRREDQLFHFFCSLLWVVKDFSRWLKSWDFLLEIPFSYAYLYVNLNKKSIANPHLVRFIFSSNNYQLLQLLRVIWYFHFKWTFWNKMRVGLKQGVFFTSVACLKFYLMLFPLTELTTMEAPAVQQ